MNKFLLEIFENITIYCQVRYIHNIPYLFIDGKQHFMLTDTQAKLFNDFKENAFKERRYDI